MIQNLNKEFWQRMQEQYPLAVDHFNTWFNEYQKEVGWNRLFNSDSDWQDRNGKNAPAPKFQDLPVEMQNGIIARYDLELNNNKRGKGKQAYIDLMAKFGEQVDDLFEDVQHNIDNRSAKLS